MKKLFLFILTICILNTNYAALALNSTQESIATDSKQISSDKSKQTEISYDAAPKWEEYVAPKYRNPRTDFSRAGSITELSIGGVLTALIITAPVGIPMVIHGTTRVKMVSYANRKKIFDEKIAEANLIEDPQERAKAYEKILKRCHLKESTKEHYARKEAKKQARKEETR